MTRRVLVIEDDPDIGRLIALQLAELDCECRLIDDGVAGLAEAEAGRYDLVILDLMLPRLDGLSIDVDRHEARVAGQRVELTAKEFELLVYFARSPGRVFTRTQLLDQVWGYSHSGYEHTVNSHINRLRNKIERDPANPDFIQTVWGVGYKFAERRA